MHDRSFHVVHRALVASRQLSNILPRHQSFPITLIYSNNDKHQSNLERRNRSPFLFAWWQSVLARSSTSNSPFPGVRGLTQCVIGPTSASTIRHLNPSNGLGKVHKCDRQTDRQTTLSRNVAKSPAQRLNQIDKGYIQSEIWQLVKFLHKDRQNTRLSVQLRGVSGVDSKSGLAAVRSIVGD